MFIKKRFALTFIISLLFALFSGCVSAGHGSETTTKSTTEPMTQATTEATTELSSPEDLTYAAVTPYYTVMLPGYWQDCAIVEQPAGGDGNIHSLRFYEKISRPTCGGHVFSLQLWEANTDFTFFPQYKVLGTLTDNRGVLLKLIAVYPSDVQFEMEAMQTYNKMSGEEARILATFTPAAGYSFTPSTNSNLFPE